MVKDYPKIKTIRYLGGKRKLVDRICGVISDNVATGSTILDMFAGTNCVAYGLKKSFQVFSNDVQAFSYIIAKTLLVKKELVSASEARNDIDWAYWDNHEFLTRHYQEALDAEKDLLSRPVEEFKPYADFCNSFGQITNAGNSSLISNNDRVSQPYRTHSPYCLFTTCFSNSYFGLKQCIQIDSLRFAIDMLRTQKQRKRDLYLCALIYAIDDCVASPGHFAQFFAPHSKESFATIVKERKKDVRETFYDLVKYFYENLAPSNFEHEAWCANYSDLFDRNSGLFSKMKNVDLIYADPPYTADHYSRFYHVLETLVKYDYPEVEGKGRYRKDRFTSNFSLKSKAYNEFERLFSLVSSLGCKFLISYNNDGLIQTERLIKLGNEYFSKVVYEDLEYNHSNQGRKKADCQKRRNPRKEYLVYCEN